jgi:hypothetical protein
MRRLLSIGIPVLFLVVIIGSFVGLYLLGSDDQSALEKIRDIVIIWIGFLWVIAVLLLAVVAGLMVWLALTLKEKIIPIMETLADTANRVKGTTEFVTEEVASPLISFYGTVAKARAMTRTVTGRDRPSSSTFSKLLKR